MPEIVAENEGQVCLRRAGPDWPEPVMNQHPYTSDALENEKEIW